MATEQKQAATAADTEATATIIVADEVQATKAPATKAAVKKTPPSPPAPPAPLTMQNVMDAQIGQGMRATIDAQPKVTVHIPWDNDMYAENQTTASVNGVNYVIRHGEDVEVPECIAEVLRNRDELRKQQREELTRIIRDLQKPIQL